MDSMPAPDRVDQIIARALIAWRLGALAVLALSAGRAAVQTGESALSFLLLCLAAAAVAASVALARRRPWRRWVVVDLACLTLLSLAPVLPGFRTGPAARSPFFLFLLVAVIAVGLADRPPAFVLLGAVAIGLANVAAARIPGSTYPLSDAVPDGVTPVAIVLVVALVARSLRASAADLHRHHEVAKRRTAELAAARERARQQEVLDGELRSTLAALAADLAVADPGLHAQVRSEARWLETVVRLGLPEPLPALLAALRELVADKRATGMTVTLTGPAAEPHIAEAAVAALVEASREALTNVAKHAGTLSATLEVRDGGPAGITVEIRDGGRGFDRRAAVAGTGLTRSIRERVALAGGRVVVDSEPGRGTAVRLWVPAAPDGKPS